MALFGKPTIGSVVRGKFAIVRTEHPGVADEINVGVVLLNHILVDGYLVPASRVAFVAHCSCCDGGIAFRQFSGAFLA